MTLTAVYEDEDDGKGDSDWTETTPASAPPAPTGTSAVSYDHNLPMRVTYSAITAGAGNYVTYQMQRRHTGGIWEEPSNRTYRSSPHPTTFTVDYGPDSFDKAGEYEFRARARQHRDGAPCSTCNNSQWGPWSTPIMGSIPNPPGLAAEVTGELTDRDSGLWMNITWQDPTPTTGQDANPTAWKVDHGPYPGCKNTGTGGGTGCTTGDSSDKLYTHNMSDQTKGTLYTANVRSRNALETSDDYPSKPAFVYIIDAPSFGTHGLNKDERKYTYHWTKPDGHTIGTPNRCGTGTGYRAEAWHVTHGGVKSAVASVTIDNVNTLTWTRDTTPKQGEWHFRVRAYCTHDGGNYYGVWSDTHVLNDAVFYPDPNKVPFSDLALAKNTDHAVNLHAPFGYTTDDEVTYSIQVTTTNMRTNKKRVGGLCNPDTGTGGIACNKIRGKVFNDDSQGILWLETQAPDGEQKLNISVAAASTDGSQEDDFDVTIKDPDNAMGQVAAPNTLSGNGNIVVYWTDPQDLHIESYDVDIGRDGNFAYGPERMTGLTEEVVDIQDLTNGVAYSIRVRGTNAEGAGAWSETVTATPRADQATVPPGMPTALSAAQTDDATIVLSWTAPQDTGGATLSYDVETTPHNSNSQFAETSEQTYSLTNLTHGTTHTFRVRAKNSAGHGPWTQAISLVPVSPVTLTNAFADLQLDNSATHTLNMADHFTGTGLTYEVLVTTTHKRTGRTSTGPINTLARNKVRGTWNDDVLTLTAGPSGHHILGMNITATDMAGGTVSDDFELTVGQSQGQALAEQALTNVLATQARALLEDASTIFDTRLAPNATRGTDTLTTFASLYGGPANDPCPLDTPLHECDVAISPDNSTAIDLADFRDKVRTNGLAISLNPTDSPDVPALTFWGSRGNHGNSDTETLTWGIDFRSMDNAHATTFGFALAESNTVATQSDDPHVRGFAESDIAAVYPYFSTNLTETTQIKSLIGWGSGHTQSRWSTEFEDDIDLTGDTDFTLGLVGAEQSLYDRDGLTFSILGDAGWSALEMTSGPASGVGAQVTRTRLGTRLGYQSEYAAHEFRVNFRADGGDGLTAHGTEFHAHSSYTWADRWYANLEGRLYKAEQATNVTHGVQGVSATLGYGASHTTGLSFELTPSYGVIDAEPNLLPIFGDTFDADTSDSDKLRARLEARMSYDMYLLGDGIMGPGETLTPYTEFATYSDSDTVRLGIDLRGDVDMGFAVEHRNNRAGDNSHTDNGIMFRLQTQF